MTGQIGCPEKQRGEGNEMLELLAVLSFSQQVWLEKAAWLSTNPIGLSTINMPTLRQPINFKILQAK
jgi:hypothetical protein